MSQGYWGIDKGLISITASNSFCPKADWLQGSSFVCIYAITKLGRCGRCWALSTTLEQMHHQQQIVSYSWIILARGGIGTWGWLRIWVCPARCTSISESVVYLELTVLRLTLRTVNLVLQCAEYRNRCNALPVVHSTSSKTRTPSSGTPSPAIIKPACPVARNLERKPRRCAAEFNSRLVDILPPLYQQSRHADK